MQECFRQQYSKFGNTREQYFHIWRSFQLDDSTDTIDGYIHKVKQVAALLDYGEPQILELFKNTLPSRLYYLLYQIDNLNVTVETAKQTLTKEKIDKQKTDQTSATSFMKTSQDKSKKSEKGVSFGALETKEMIDRHSSSIDKLTSLVNKLGGRGNFHYNNRGYRPNYRNRSGSRNYRYGNGYRGNNNSQNYSRRDNYRQDYGNLRYRNRNRSPSQDHSKSRQRYRSNSRDNFRNRSYDRCQSRNRESRNRDRSSSREERQRPGTESRDRDRNRERERRSTTRSRSSSCVNTNRDRLRCYRCSEYDHFARECPNALTNEESGSESEELDDSTWQMLSQVETSPFQDFDMQDLNM